MRTWIELDPKEEVFIKKATNHNNATEALKTYLAQCIGQDSQRNNVVVESIRDDLIKAMAAYTKLSILDEHGKEQIIPTSQIGMMARGWIREKNKFKELSEAQAVEIAELKTQCQNLSNDLVKEVAKNLRRKHNIKE